MRRRTLPLMEELVMTLVFALAAAIFVCLQVKPLKKLHPIVFIAASAVIGAVFQF